VPGKNVTGTVYFVACLTRVLIFAFYNHILEVVFVLIVSIEQRYHRILKAGEAMENTYFKSITVDFSHNFSFLNVRILRSRRTSKPPKVIHLSYIPFCKPTETGYLLSNCLCSAHWYLLNASIITNHVLFVGRCEVP